MADSIILAILLYAWVFFIGLFTGALICGAVYNTQKTLSFRDDPIAVILCALGFVLVFVRVGFGINVAMYSVLYCIITVLYVIGATYDNKNKKIPWPTIVIPAILIVIFMIIDYIKIGQEVAIILPIIGKSVDIPDVAIYIITIIIGAIVVPAIMMIISRILPEQKLFSPSDILLGMTTGLILGWIFNLISFAIALILYMILSPLQQNEHGKMIRKRPFGPFMMTISWISLMYGSIIYALIVNAI